MTKSQTWLDIVLQKRAVHSLEWNKYSLPTAKDSGGLMLVSIPIVQNSFSF